MLIAMTRPVSASLGDCELTHLARSPIDVERAREQHAGYQRALESLGATIVTVPGAAELPDAVFIEDTALVLEEVAIIARPGAASRRAETGAVARALAGYRPVHQLTAPATLDGGDVLRVGRTLFVGLSARSNPEGVAQLRRLTDPLGYAVVPVEVRGCLHLKSAVSQIGEGELLINPAWVSPPAFGAAELVCVDPGEPGGANALRLGQRIIYPTHYPRTADRLAARGVTVLTVDSSELAKAEGGVTCCSLLFSADAGLAA